MDVLSDRECHELLYRAAVAHIAVVSEGEPYVTPISFVTGPGEIAFRTVRGRRVAALSETPRVCIEVSEFDERSGDWRSVVVFGTASLVEDEATVQAVVAGLLRKYRTVVDLFGPPSVPGGEPVVVRVEIDTITGRRASSFFSTRTRPGRL
jgi:nitroimidazol reductase NimA-like FMN-containing flavoprotein (pyridoxamine 5'-phosphate oxidase superfamily)